MEQREIKVRFWLTEKSVMSDTYTIDDLLNGGWYDIGPHITLQFTGLHDKNGKEIYEGYILKWIAEHEQGMLVHQREVVFIAGFFGMDSVIGKQPLSEYKSEYEVIGNIYENPELLTPNN